MDNKNFNILKEISFFHPYYTKSTPYPNKETYKEAVNFIAKYYPFLNIFNFPLCTYPNFQSMFERYRNECPEQYVYLLQTYVCIKALNEESKKYCKNLNNPYIRSLYEKLNDFIVAVHTLFIFVHDNKLLDEYDINNMHPLLQNSYANIEKIKQNRLKRNEERKKLADDMFNMPITDRVAPFIEDDNNKICNNEKIEHKDFVSLTDFAAKLQNNVKEESNNNYWDTDDYETEEEFNETLNYIKKKQNLLDDFIKIFDQSEIMSKYHNENNEAFMKLAQCLRNTKDINGKEFKVETFYTLRGADDNNKINNILYAYQEEVKKFLKFANLYILPIEYLQLPPSLKPFFDDPQNDSEK